MQDYGQQVKCLRHEHVTIITTWMLNGKIAKKIFLKKMKTKGKWIMENGKNFYYFFGFKKKKITQLVKRIAAGCYWNNLKAGRLKFE